MATVTYNGKSTTLTDGQKATLSCAEKKAVTDIVAAFDGFGRITYNGTETAIDGGKTATLACAGKKMLTDVVIALTEVAPVLEAGLYDVNDNLVASWDTLVNTYGMDVEKDYTASTYKTDTASPYYVLTNYSELSAGEKIIIADGVDYIGTDAFYKCSSLTSITVPNGVTIGDWAFEACSSLTNFSVLGAMTAIGGHTFFGCNALAGVHITDVAAWCSSIFRTNYDNPLCIAKKLYVNGELAIDLVIPVGVTSINECIFWSCTCLKSVAIPDSVAVIGKCNFYSCADLTDVYYGGTEEQWQAITIGSSNGYLTDATIHYNCVV